MNGPSPEIIQLRCFLAAAEALHFGQAAQSLGMLPASFGRHLKALEDRLGTPLLARTTRHVALTEAGVTLLEDARDVVDRVDRLAARARALRPTESRELRVGAIDSASVGLMPQLLAHFRCEQPGERVTLIEDKTIRLLPRLVSGRLDLAFVRPPEVVDANIVFRSLFAETAVVAIPETHRLATRKAVAIGDLAEEPLIVPDRRSRPHSHDLTMKLFLGAGLTARVAQIADEKQTIVNMVATGLGLAIVPRWTMRLTVPGVAFVPIETEGGGAPTKLALSAAFMRGVRDPLRDALLATLDNHLEEIAATA